MNPRVRLGLAVSGVVVVGAVGLGALRHKNTGNRSVPTLAPQNWPMASADDAGGSAGGFGSGDDSPYVPYSAEGSSISGFQNRTDIPTSSPTPQTTQSVDFTQSSPQTIDTIQPIPTSSTSTYESSVSALGGTAGGYYVPDLPNFSLPKFDYANPALIPGIKLPLSISSSGPQ